MPRYRSWLVLAPPNGVRTDRGGNIAPFRRRPCCDHFLRSDAESCSCAFRAKCRLALGETDPQLETIHYPPNQQTARATRQLLAARLFRSARPRRETSRELHPLYPTQSREGEFKLERIYPLGQRRRA